MKSAQAVNGNTNIKQRTTQCFIREEDFYSVSFTGFMAVSCVDLSRNR